MTRRISGLYALLVMSAAPAHGAGSENLIPSAYEAAMQAQYAARAAPSPARPEEAQRIYDAYLRSIGQAAKAHSDDGVGAAMPSH